MKSIMKTKQEAQHELIKEFGENFNTIDNLIKWLKSRYHPQVFTSMEEFVKTSYFHVTEDMSIDEYTDDYITENENYIIVLFNDSRDFNNMPEDYCDDIVISYDKKSGKILKFYYTGYNNLVLPYIQSFVDIDKTL